MIHGTVHVNLKNHYAQLKKRNTKDYMLYGSTYVKFLEKNNAIGTESRSVATWVWGGSAN